MDRIEFSSNQIETTKKRMLHELLLVRHTFFFILQNYESSENDRP